MSFFDRLFKSKEVVEQKRSDTGFYYVCQCRLNTLAGITPSNIDFVGTDDYNKIIQLGHQYIDENGLLAFAGFFQGDQYFVELWTAHIICDHRDTNDAMKLECINIITKYAYNSLSPKVSLEEQGWLKKNNLSQ